MHRLLLTRALGDLGRNRLHAAVTLIGLSLALAAAIVVGLFVRQQYSFEHFVSGHERIFRMTGTIAQPGQAERVSAITPSVLAGALRMRASDLESVARLAQDFPAMRAGGASATVRELAFAWADPDFFKVLPLPAIAGDPASGLDAPDSVVLTRSAALRYFGRDRPVGAYLELLTPGNSVRRLRVTAVLEDLPAETHLAPQIFASARSAGSLLAQADANPGPGLSGVIFTYVRAKPGVTAKRLQPVLDEIVKPFQAMAAASGTKIGLHAIPIGDIHFGPAEETPGAKPTIDPATILAIGAVGLLILIMAATNYVALMTARAGRRATEVAVRKACGASRRDLVVQFLGESFVHVLLAMILAMALVELLLPAVNAALGQSLRFDLLRDPTLLPLLAGFAFAVALLAGLYPAFILSGFRPSVSLGGGSDGAGGSTRVRQAMVMVQFAILVGLAVATLTIYRQTGLALGSALGAGRGPVLLIVTDCASGLPQAARELPGVRAATCAASGALNLGPQGAVTVVNRAGQRFTPGFVDVDPWYFDAFGLRAIAGRTFSPDIAADAAQGRIVINATAARRFGFPSPQAAVGQRIALSLEVGANPTLHPAEIIGVVPDQPASVLAPAGELIYNDYIKGAGVLAVHASPRDLPRVRAGLARLWQRMGDGTPLSTNLLAQMERDRYRGIIVQGTIVAACAIMALIIAAMGLYALSAFAADQRTKEIGVRKAMGADTSDVVKLLLWQFARPVLLAGLIALPLSYLVMSRWLEKFAARVDLPAWLLAGALVVSTAIAMITVGTHVWLTARTKPARALRYE